MTGFDYGAEAELFLARNKRLGSWARYRRFACAAEAIRYAIEELPRELLLGTHLQVGEDRYDGEGIRRLYHHADYPLPRSAAAGSEGRESLETPLRRLSAPTPRKKQVVGTRS